MPVYQDLGHQRIIPGKHPKAGGASISKIPSKYFTKLLVSPFIISIILPYIIPHITPVGTSILMAITTSGSCSLKDALEVDVDKRCEERDHEPNYVVCRLQGLRV